MAADSIRAVLSFISTLDELDIDDVIGGSVASSIHGEPQATADADLLARLDTSMERLITRLSGAF